MTGDVGNTSTYKAEYIVVHTRFTAAYLVFIGSKGTTHLLDNNDAKEQKLSSVYYWHKISHFVFPYYCYIISALTLYEAPFPFPCSKTHAI